MKYLISIFYLAGLLILSLCNSARIPIAESQPKVRDRSRPFLSNIKTNFDPNYYRLTNCPPLPKSTNATDVSKLRPSDISVAMALGDSITAGFAMNTEYYASSFFEFRGDVASIGGNEHAITVPNFIRNVTQGGTLLRGASVGKSFPWDALKWKQKIIKPHNPPVDRLNGAQSMAKVQHISSQIDYLIKEMPKQGVDVQNEWKVLTILIGANDLCVSCEPGRQGDQQFKDAINQALAKIKEEIPRVFVNLVSLFNISQAYHIGNKDIYCSVVYDLVTECPCMTKFGDEGRSKLDINSRIYNQRLQEIEDEWKSRSDSQFKVTLQPFLQDLVIPNTEFLSNLDCFHPSTYANIGFSVGLWNSMLSPHGKKPTFIDMNIKPICPTMNTYLQ